MKKHDLPECHLPSKQHQERQRYHLETGSLLKESVNQWNFYKQAEVMANKPQGTCSLMAKGFSKVPFGPVNSVENAGCICFVSFLLLKQYDKKFALSFLEWVDAVVEKGYRAWKFRDYPVTFSSSKVDVDKVKDRFDGVVDLKDCYTEGQLIEKLGPLEGIGGNTFLLDNVIAYLSGKEAVSETRLTSVDQILVNLQNNLWVPLRVNNAIYHQDPERKGGHYITLFGVKNYMAYVWDSSLGEVHIPFEILMEAAVADNGLIAAWDLSGSSKA